MRAALADRDAPEAPGLRVLFPGLYAWAATVLYPASLRGVSAWVRTLAGVALLLLVTGVVVSRRDPFWGRLSGLHGFVLSSLGAWLSMRDVVAVDRLDPVRAALGAVGWVIFALSWGAPRETEQVPEDDPHVLAGEALRPRNALPGGSVLVLGAAVVAAAAPLLLAWRVTRSSHALFGHAVSVLAAIAVVTGGAEVAIRRGSKRRSERPSRRLGRASVALFGLSIVIVAGLLRVVLK